MDGQTGLLFGDTAGSASWTVQVPETGLYNLELSYYALPDSAEQISIGILVDGELPYTEANACVLHRRYSNEGIRTDQQGNGLRPLTQQSSQWERIFLSDQTGVVGELSFYLEKGEHTLSIASSGVRFAVRELQLGQKPYLPAIRSTVAFTETAVQKRRVSFPASWKFFRRRSIFTSRILRSFQAMTAATRW